MKVNENIMVIITIGSYFYCTSVHEMSDTLQGFS